MFNKTSMFNQLNDVSDVLKERLKDRFWGAFAISFAVINWRAIYVLLFPSSEVGFIDRLDWIEENLYADRIPAVLKTLVGPLLLCSFSVAVVPWMTNVLERWRYQAYIARQNNQLDLDQTRKDQMIELQATRTAYSRLENERNDLQRQLVESTKQVERITQDRGKDKLVHEGQESNHLRTMRLILELSGVERKYLSFKKRPLRNTADKNIELLETTGFIQQDGHSWYKLTPLGEQILELWPPKRPDGG